MTIVSVSLDEESTAALDKITELLDLKGRSEAVRTALRSTVTELKRMDDFGDVVEGVLIIVHEHHNNQLINVIQHRYEEIVKTQLHSHLQNKKCLEVMIISGEGSIVRTMLKDITAVDEAYYVKFVRS